MLCSFKYAVLLERKQCSEGVGSNSFPEAEVPRVWATHLSVWRHQLGVTEKSGHPTTPRPVESALLGVSQRQCPCGAQARFSVRTLYASQMESLWQGRISPWLLKNSIWFSHLHMRSKRNLWAQIHASPFLEICQPCVIHPLKGAGSNQKLAHLNCYCILLYKNKTKCPQRNTVSVFLSTQ